MFVHVRSCARQWRKKRKRNKEKHLGHRAILNVPGQRGGNITIYAAITQNGVLHQHAKIAPYNTDRILTCLDRLSIGLSRYWTNASRNWFHYSSTSTQRSPFLSFCPSTWQWNGLWSPTLCYTLIQAMEEACDLIDAESWQGWSCHSRRFFPCCFAREDIACDVDEVAISRYMKKWC